MNGAIALKFSVWIGLWERIYGIEYGYPGILAVCTRRDTLKMVSANSGMLCAITLKFDVGIDLGNWMYGVENGYPRVP